MGRRPEQLGAPGRVRVVASCAPCLINGIVMMGVLERSTLGVMTTQAEFGFRLNKLLAVRRGVRLMAGETPFLQRGMNFCAGEEALFVAVKAERVSLLFQEQFVSASMRVMARRTFALLYRGMNGSSFSYAQPLLFMAFITLGGS